MQRIRQLQSVVIAVSLVMYSGCLLSLESPMYRSRLDGRELPGDATEEVTSVADARTDTIVVDARFDAATADNVVVDVASVDSEGLDAGSPDEGTKADDASDTFAIDVREMTDTRDAIVSLDVADAVTIDARDVFVSVDVSDAPEVFVSLDAGDPEMGDAAVDARDDVSASDVDPTDVISRDVLLLCAVPCPPGRVCCNGQCVDLSTNENACGSCLRTCPPSTVCAGGTCSACALGLSLCSSGGDRCCLVGVCLGVLCGP